MRNATTFSKTMVKREGCAMNQALFDPAMTSSPPNDFMNKLYTRMQLFGIQETQPVVPCIKEPNRDNE